MKTFRAAASVFPVSSMYNPIKACSSIFQPNLPTTQQRGIHHRFIAGSKYQLLRRPNTCFLALVLDFLRRDGILRKYEFPNFVNKTRSVVSLSRPRAEDSNRDS